MVIKPHTLLLLFAILLHSCAKDTAESQQTTLEVDLEGIEVGTTETEYARAAAPKSITSTEPVKLADIPFDKNFGLEISLAPETPSSASDEASTIARSTGVVQQGPKMWKLVNGIKYRVLAYKGDETKVVDTIYTVGNYSGNGLRLNAGQTYTFVIYSTLSFDDVPAAPAGKLTEANFTNITGDTDFIYYTETRKLNAGRNDLKVIMKHVFSQLTTSIDASHIGNITALKAKVGDHYLAPTIKLSNGTVTAYNNKVAQGKNVPFVLNSSNNSTHDPIIICNSGASASTLTIEEITINNITKTNLTVPNIQLTPGTRYVLKLKIKTFTEEGIDLGTVTYAPGNLIYDRNADKYGFAKSGDGDYWFKNYLKPRRRDLDNKPSGENNQRANSTLNGGSGDPCTKVLPLNAWRLPNRTEMENIREATRSEVPGHPGPNIYAPVRYIETNYAGTNKTGMYLGTQVNPGTNANKYLFIAFEGTYNDNVARSQYNHTGWYIIKNGNSHELMQIGNNIHTFGFSELKQDFSVSIRCVKNK